MSKKNMSLALSIAINMYWGLTTVLMKNVLYFMTPMMYIFLRFTFAAVSLLIIFKNKIIYINKSTCVKGIILGLLTVIHLELTVVALNFISATNSVFYSQFVFIFVPLIVWLKYKKPPIKQYYFSLITILVGMMIFSRFRITQIKTGDIITIFSTMINSFLIIATAKYVNSGESPYNLGVIQMISATLFSLPFVFIGDLSVSWTTDTILILVLTGIIGSGIAFSANNYAQKYISSTTASLVKILSPIFGVVGARIIPNINGMTEPVTKAQYIGIIFLCVGMMVYFLDYKIIYIKLKKIINLNKKTKINFDKGRNNYD